MNDWISVKDRLPIPFDQEVLFTYTALFNGEKGYDIGSYCNDWFGKSQESAYEDGEVTHWMPLPKFPEVL